MTIRGADCGALNVFGILKLCIEYNRLLIRLFNRIHFVLLITSRSLVDHNNFKLQFYASLYVYKYQHIIQHPVYYTHNK